MTNVDMTALEQEMSEFIDATPTPIPHREYLEAPVPLTGTEAINGSMAHLAVVAQALKTTMRDAPNWNSLSFVQQEILEQMQVCIARILTGRIDAKDHAIGLVDHAGFFHLHTVQPRVAGE